VVILSFQEEFQEGRNMKVAVASVLRAAEQIACPVAKYM
jgi:hypothetical protein